MKKDLFATGFSAAVLIVSGALSLLGCSTAPSHPAAVQRSTVADGAGVVGNITYRVCYDQSHELIKKIFAEVDGKPYTISFDDRDVSIEKVVCMMDFDHDGYLDLLLAGMENMVSPDHAFFFLSYDGEGRFNVSEDFGYCINYGINTFLDEDADYEEVTTVDVTASDYLEDGQVDILHQSFRLVDGKAVKVSEERSERIGGTIAQVVPVDIEDPEMPYIWSYDLNRDGKPESIISELVCSCAGGVSTALVLHGDTIVFPDGDRFGILPTLTNGYHDLVIGAAYLMVWDGKEYVAKE